jgi:uncharacterized protein YndB with AHSA1/START domain
MASHGNERKTRIATPTDKEIVLTRDFRAPKELVFDLWTKAEHMRRWIGCEGMMIPECAIDFRVGGAFRVLMQMAGPGGGVLCGEYTEIVRHERIVFNERWLPIPNSDHVVTLTFVEKNGITTMTQHILHQSKENRDGHLQSGLDEHVHHAHETMDSLLRSPGAPAVAHAP